MPIFDLYSKRQKRLRGETPDVFTYDAIPNALRVQIVHIWRDAIGEAGDYYQLASDLYEQIHNTLCREYGVFRLNKGSSRTWSGEVSNYFLTCGDTEKALDVIELVFHGIEVVTGDGDYRAQTEPTLTPDEAVAELNTRFLEHGVGYHFEAGQLIRKDSELIHTETVIPALHFLSEPEYNGANEEFLKAHEHYRHGRHKESLNECLKAYESTMKAICHKRRWAYGQNDTAKKLIDICFVNGLVPSFLQTQITALKSVLESGIPTVRNKLGGHGQGAQQTIVPPHLVSYALHLTATTIVFLVESEKQLP
ncbi:MAG: hypothetical protein ABW007_27280 [Chitinophagaceae bacterium]